MAYIHTTDPADADGRLNELYENQQEHFGYVPNYAQVFTPRPEMMELWVKLLAGIKKNMNSRLFELTTFVAAVALKSSYCSLAHGTSLLDFFSSDEVASIASLEYENVVEEHEAVAMDYARQVAVDATLVNINHVERLHEAGFTDADVFDIAAAASARAFFTKLLDGLGANPDSVYAHLGPGLCEALTVGRPMDKK